jgi:hypothetical protein
VYSAEGVLAPLSTERKQVGSYEHAPGSAEAEVWGHLEAQLNGLADKRTEFDLP